MLDTLPSFMWKMQEERENLPMCQTGPLPSQTCKEGQGYQRDPQRPKGDGVSGAAKKIPGKSSKRRESAIGTPETEKDDGFQRSHHRTVG
jgi:hypothetical protein